MTCESLRGSRLTNPTSCSVVLSASYATLCSFGVLTSLPQYKGHDHGRQQVTSAYWYDRLSLISSLRRWTLLTTPYAYEKEADGMCKANEFSIGSLETPLHKHASQNLLNHHWFAARIWRNMTHCRQRLKLSRVYYITIGWTHPHESKTHWWRPIFVLHERSKSMAECTCDSPSPEYEGKWITVHV